MLLLAACTGAGTDDTGTEPVYDVPVITDATVACDGEKALWTFAVVADAWTGNGQVVLSADGEYVEKHTMFSVVAEPDGTGDELALTLSVVPDWRDVSLGSSTAFNCGAGDLTGIVRIWERDASGQADCRAFGSSPERWTGWDAGVSCSTLLEPGG